MRGPLESGDVSSMGPTEERSGYWIDESVSGIPRQSEYGHTGFVPSVRQPSGH